jgi:lipooligosaccharide transport system permease protein
MSTPPAARALEHWATAYRHAWRGTVMASVLSPLAFLAAMGIGLGSIVDQSSHATASLGGFSYLVFLAPGLLAASAMQAGATESTYPVMGAFKWQRTYLAMVASPLGVGDVVAGHLGFMALRILGTSTIFFAVIAVFGAVQSPWAILAIPAAVLTGMAFACPIAAYAATRETDGAFAPLMRFVIVPMFLFSGTFFPISQLPAILRPIAYLTPLWHGVSLCRGLSLGTISMAAAVGHALYLALFVMGGFVAARITYRRRLVT